LPGARLPIKQWAALGPEHRRLGGRRHCPG